MEKYYLSFFFKFIVPNPLLIPPFLTILIPNGFNLTLLVSSTLTCYSDVILMIKRSQKFFRENCRRQLDWIGLFEAQKSLGE